MTSNDLIILEAINGLEGKIINLKSEMNRKIEALQVEMKDTRNELLTEIRINQHDVAHLQTSVYWGFAVIAFVVAFISLNPFRKEKTEHKPEMSERELKAMIREEIRIAQSAANIN